MNILKTMQQINKRILLVGSGNHQFVYNYAHWLRKQVDFKYNVDILSFNAVNKENSKAYDSIYRINDKTILNRIISKIKGLRMFYRFYIAYNQLIKKLPEYEYIHFHYISVDSYFLVKQFRKFRKSKIILTIWGSDLYQLKPINESKFKNTCNYADSISFTNNESLEYFKSKFTWGRDNLKVCRFGLAPLDFLKNLSEKTKTECKHELGLDTKKYVITIGYNLSPAQQHIQILEQLKNQNISVLKEKLQLLIPITYGGSDAYKNMIIEKLNHLHFEYVYYDKFLNDATVALIRKATDIMIQLQITDQFSGSMQEHLFAQNVVITGSWLPYKTLKEQGAWFIEVNRIEELTTILPDVLNNYESYYRKTVNTSKAINELSSWENNIKNWLEFYI